MTAIPVVVPTHGRSGQPQRVRRLLHIFASFGYGGVPIRICEVINGLGGDFRHTVVALDGRFDARGRLAREAEVTFRPLALPRYNLLQGLAKVRQVVGEEAPDLLLTYNWGAIEAALASRLIGGCELIHFESGFGSEEKDGQLWRRNLLRRVALGGARKVVVPSTTLMQIARSQWAVPAHKLIHIPNGVDYRKFRAEPGRRDPLLRLGSGGETTVIGTIAPLRPEKNVGRLLRAFAQLQPSLRCTLVIAGEGAERENLQRLAEELGIAARTAF